MEIKMKVDIVYLWCNDADAEWSAKRKKYMQQNVYDEQAVCKGRFVQNDELKYSLRSVAKYMPWVNHIYIVSDSQVPAWLNLKNPKITMVKHEEILPKECLPMFNSSAIECGLANIPNLSEYFAFMNDDMLFTAPLGRDDFFTKSGKIIYRMTYVKPLRQPTMYEAMILNMQNLCEVKYGYKCKYFPHHNLDVYSKSAYKECLAGINILVQETLKNRFRSQNDWQRVIVSYYMLAKGYGELKVINKYKESVWAWLKHNFLDLGKKDSLVLTLHNKDYDKKLRRYKPKFLCMEDSEYVDDKDRKRGKDFLEKLFPDKSEFEK